MKNLFYNVFASKGKTQIDAMRELANTVDEGLRGVEFQPCGGINISSSGIGPMKFYLASQAFFIQNKNEN